MINTVFSVCRPSDLNRGLALLVDAKSKAPAGQYVLGLLCSGVDSSVIQSAKQMGVELLPVGAIHPNIDVHFSLSFDELIQFYKHYLTLHFFKKGDASVAYFDYETLMDSDVSGMLSAFEDASLGSLAWSDFMKPESDLEFSHRLNYGNQHPGFWHFKNSPNAVELLSQTVEYLKKFGFRSDDLDHFYDVGALRVLHEGLSGSRVLSVKEYGKPFPVRFATDLFNRGQQDHKTRVYEGRLFPAVTLPALTGNLTELPALKNEFDFFTEGLKISRADRRQILYADERQKRSFGNPFQNKNAIKLGHVYSSKRIRFAVYESPEYKLGEKIFRLLGFIERAFKMLKNKITGK